MAFDDLSCTGVHYRCAIRPAPGGTMYPVNDIITYIHGVCAVGQHFYLKSISVAGGLKCMVPPGCAFHQSAPNRLWSTIVQIINNWLYRITDSSTGVFLFQTMTDNKMFFQRLRYRCAEIIKSNGNKTGARIKNPRFIIIIGQLYE